MVWPVAQWEGNGGKALADTRVPYGQRCFIAAERGNFSLDKPRNAAAFCGIRHGREEGKSVAREFEYRKRKRKGKRETRNLKYETDDDACARLNRAVVSFSTQQPRVYYDIRISADDGHAVTHIRGHTSVTEKLLNLPGGHERRRAK